MVKPVTLSIGGKKVVVKAPSGSYAKKKKSRTVTKPVVKKMIENAISESVEYREFDPALQGDLDLPVTFAAITAPQSLGISLTTTDYGVIRQIDLQTDNASGGTGARIGDQVTLKSLQLVWDLQANYLQTKENGMNNFNVPPTAFAWYKPLQKEYNQSVHLFLIRIAADYQYELSTATQADRLLAMTNLIRSLPQPGIRSNDLPVQALEAKKSRKILFKKTINCRKRSFVARVCEQFDTVHNVQMYDAVSSHGRHFIKLDEKLQYGRNNVIGRAPPDNYGYYMVARWGNRDEGLTASASVDSSPIMKMSFKKWYTDA